MEGTLVVGAIASRFSINETHAWPMPYQGEDTHHAA